MNKTKYLLPILAIAAGSVFYTSANNDTTMKVKSSASTQNFTAVAPITPQRLTAAEDGAPYGLQLLSIDNKMVTLRWNNPEATNGYFEDFEAHEDFAINSPGNIGWSYLDMDNEDTYTWTATSFPTQGQKMAYVIMNPATTTPSVADWPAFQPYSGTKMLVSFTVDGGNNDYIISPQLNFEENFQISFRAKSYTDAYGPERIRVGYSTTGTQASNFTFVNEGKYIEVPTDWQLYKFDIPQDAKYVTINCVSHEAFMLLIDDIFVGTNRVRPQAPAQSHLEGFNLYRNNDKVNDELITEVTYTDNVPLYGTYQYKISAVYSDGREVMQEQHIEVEVPDIRLLPFEDNFDKNILEEDKWSTPVDEQGNESRWSSSYHPYGLVDYAAQYVYSSLTNYSQSLISAEMNTIDIENTYLRFNLRHVNYNYEVGDSLAVEISCDNQQTWQRITAFGNDEQTFDWRIEQYCLKDLLTNNLFNIRFRAFGADAYYIDYWYVDDIKVWNPQWTAASLSVQTQGSPFAQCDVTLTADHGAVIIATTDNNGVIDIPQIEKGTYTITIDQRGYTPYTQQWEIYDDNNNTFTAQILRPNLVVSNYTPHADLATESRSSQTITLTNTGESPVSWNLVPQYKSGTGDNSNVWDIQTAFDASGDLQTSIAFDGEYFYTTSTFYLGTFFKYDKSGKFLEEFTIPGMYYMLYDFAFDGTYFYGSDYSNILFCLDLRNKRLIEEITIAAEPDLKITHCSYDPRNDQFWVGSFNSICRVDREGNVTVPLRNISTTSDIGAFGSAFDNVTPGGPYLWFSNEEIYGTNQIDQLQIIQYDLNTRALTSVMHLVDDVPGYKIGTPHVPNYICGIEATTNYIDGKLSLVGIIKQSPSRIFVYELATTQDWLNIEPEAGTLAAGMEQVVTFNFDTRNSSVGNTYSIPLSLFTVPQLDMADVTVSHTATQATLTPRPTQLTAVAQEAAVALTWQHNTATHDGFNIYRNGEKVNDNIVTENTYTDTQLIAGNYTYTVTAIYGDSESEHADPAHIYLKAGAPYFPPIHVTHNVSGNRYVNLQWQSPETALQENQQIRWDNGRNADAMGMADGGYFWAAVAWDHTELINYRNMMIESVDVFIQERFLSLSLQIYKDNKRIVSQNINSDDIIYGSYNTIMLKNPIAIEPGCDYRVALLIAHDAGARPLGIDNSPSVNGKGNIVSTDGKEWYPLTHIGMDGNFNIAVNIIPAATGEEAPIGYNIYRNGERINTATISEMTYTDEVTAPGTYTYQVASVYDDGGVSAPSTQVKAQIIDLSSPIPPANVVAATELNRTIHVRWDFPLPMESSFPVDLTRVQATAEEGYPEYVNSFRGNMPGEMGIASDGNFIYTTLHSTNGTICKYSLTGEYIESILINKNLQGIRNLTYDGSDFYATDGNSFIYHIDIENRAILDTISISEIARHIAYIPELDNGRGGFEVGDWETSIYVSKQGAKLGDGPTLKGAAGSAYYNGTLYTFEQGYENPYMICCYDYATGALRKTIDISNYIEINPAIGSMAGGMSVITTNEGLTLLAVALQEQANCNFFFFDLGSIMGLEGYNVYRNGEKRNTEPIKFRYFTEDESTTGTYAYEIETVYIDGSTSALSQAAYVDIYDAENCETPSDVKVTQSTYGYNVNISFVDPTATQAAIYESFEEAATNTPLTHNEWINNEDAWQVTTATSYHGNNAIEIAKEADGWLLIPMYKCDDDMILTFVARNHDDHVGNGSLRVLTSANGSNLSDFIPMTSITTGEAWKQYSTTIPAGTDYVAIHHVAGTPRQYVDAIAIDARYVGQAYGYDIMRDGKQINDHIITDVSFTDRNLEPGTYNYQVRAHYLSSCISDYTQPQSIEVDYSNGCQKPGMLFVSTLETGANSLAWSAPALGDAVSLKWHNGSAHDAAGMPSGGAFFAGVQWNSDELKPYECMSLSEVELYINQIPDALFILIYEGSNLIAQQYVPNLKQYSFNTIELEHPLLINTTKTLRVVVYIEHNEITVPLGYDEGPGKVGRGDLYSSDGINWSTLNANDIDGNWNITIGLRAYAYNDRAKAKSEGCNLTFEPLTTTSQEAIRGMALAQVATSERNTFEGYNVYCNSKLLNDTPLQETYYIDEESHPGNFYEYQVKAIYSGCGEVGSNIVRIPSTAGIGHTSHDGVNVAVRDNRVYITGLNAGEKVTLVDATGKIIHTGTANGEIEYVINTAILPEGVYLVNTAHACHKVVIAQ